MKKPRIKIRYSLENIQLDEQNNPIEYDIIFSTTFKGKEYKADFHVDFVLTEEKLQNLQSVVKRGFFRAIMDNPEHESYFKK